MDITGLIGHIRNLLLNYELVYGDRQGNSYVLANNRYAVYLNIIQQHISIECSGNILMFLSKNNISNGFTSDITMDDWHLLYDIIIPVIMDNDELERLGKLMQKCVDNEKYEQASNIRDIIDEIKYLIK